MSDSCTAGLCNSRKVGILIKTPNSQVGISQVLVDEPGNTGKGNLIDFVKNNKIIL